MPNRCTTAPIPSNHWLPDLDHLRSLITHTTRALVVIDPNNPTGAVYPDELRRALIALGEEHGLVILADEVYGDLAYDGPMAPMATLDLDAPIISYSSLSKAYLAPGWRAGWMAVGATPRLDGALAAIKKLADGRLCSPGPMQYGVVAALTGDRSHQATFRQELRRARRADDRRGSTRSMAFRALHRTGRSMRCREWSCRRGEPTKTTSSRCSARPGFFAFMVRGLAQSPPEGSSGWSFSRRLSELDGIYDDIAAFTREYLDISSG